MGDFFERGSKVNFKGNAEFKAVNGTYVWAYSPHEMLTYYIEHPDGNITKEYMKNARLGDGFEQPHSDQFKTGVKYICVFPTELEPAV